MTPKVGNGANLRTGCRVKQTCEGLHGENRRSREERQGRNKQGDWQPQAEGWETTREWTCNLDTGGEEIFGKPQERSFAQKPLVTAVEEAKPREPR